MRYNITFEQIKEVEKVVGTYGCRQRLAKAIGAGNTSRLLSAYVAVKGVGVPADKADNTMSALLKAWEAPLPQVPEKEEGNVLFLVPYKAFPLSDGTVIPNGIAVKYSVDGVDYTLSRTGKEHLDNVVACYHNTKNPEVRKRFEVLVNGHSFEDPRTVLFNERKFYKDEPIFKALRQSGEVDWIEYNPFSGLDEEEVALLKAQRDDYELRHWGDEVLEALKEVRPLMSTEPLKAIELIKLVAEQLEDMTKLDVHQKRCGEYLEDTCCDDNSWEIENVKREVRISPKEREYRWALKRDVAKMARELGAEKVLNWVNHWVPTESAYSVDVVGESLRIARAIGYKEACELYFQGMFKSLWKEELAVLLAYNSEAENAYFASEKVSLLLSEGKSLEEALNTSVYDVFIDAAEHLTHGEIDEEIIYNWLNSTKIDRFLPIAKKIQKVYKAAKRLQYETRQVENVSELYRVRELEEAGINVNPNIYVALREENVRLSRKIEEL